MAKKYFTLCTRENGKWAPQFGDFDRAVVKEEEHGYSEPRTANYVPKKDRKIIVTSPRSVDIGAAIAKLNEEPEHAAVSEIYNRLIADSFTDMTKQIEGDALTMSDGEFVYTVTVKAEKL